MTRFDPQTDSPGRSERRMGGASPSSPGDTTIYRRVEPGEQHQALSLLLTGRVRHQDASTEHFLRTAADEQLSLDELWAAYIGNDPVGVLLLVPNPGRTAMSFISPISHPSRVAMMGDLVRTGCTRQDPSRMCVIQALLDEHREFERQALTLGGFEHLAHLVYMNRDTTPATTDHPSGFDPMRVLHWDPSRHAIFAEAILKSYEDTLDCPTLVGKRQIDDIITGHMATGRFDPDLWVVLIDADRPVAVMLMNPVPHGQSMELVYLGVHPDWRGNGIGGRLLTHGLKIANRHGIKEMLLAVDESNTPAVKLYRQLGFRPKSRKNAMILMLPQSG